MHECGQSHPQCSQQRFCSSTLTAQLCPFFLCPCVPVSLHCAMLPPPVRHHGRQTTHSSIKCYNSTPVCCAGTCLYIYVLALAFSLSLSLSLCFCADRRRKLYLSEQAAAKGGPSKRGVAKSMGLSMEVQAELVGQEQGIDWSLPGGGDIALISQRLISHAVLIAISPLNLACICTDSRLQSKSTGPLIVDHKSTL